jgi:elongation factor P
MISANSLRAGMVIVFKNELHSVFSVMHRTPGNLRAFVQAKLRNLRTGAMFEHRFSSSDQVDRAILEQHEMEYLFDDGGNIYTFMNIESYEQVELSKDDLGDNVFFLLPNTTVTAEFYEGKPISVSVPQTVVMTVVETEPGIKSATASSVNKPAKLETGLVVQVPPFISEGEKIVVNTAEQTYVSRAN